jgi:hypothetical protein
MYKELVGKIVDEARSAGANLVIWDRRDTFTVEAEDLEKIEVADDYLKVDMQDGKVQVYVTHEAIYKLVVERERVGSGRSGARAGFGATS